MTCKTIDTIPCEEDDGGWSEMINELNEQYMEAFRWANELGMVEASMELSAFGYDYDHIEELRSRVYREIADYECYQEHPEWFADDEIPSRPEYFEVLSDYLYRS